MSECYVGEVRLVAFKFAPVGWTVCDGHTLSISEYNTLFNLIGTTYGGDGVSNFALPNLQGRLPIHQGFNGSSYYTMGQMDGTEMVTLNASQFPAHNHTLTGTSVAGASNSPGGNVLANLANVYVNAAPGNAMASGTLTPVINGNQPHENRQPYLVLNWVIALYGVYPSQ